MQGTIATNPPGEIRWRVFYETESKMQWRDCTEFPDYEISEMGDIRRIRPSLGNRVVGKVLKPFFNLGYKKYSLYRDGKQFNVFAHRLVAMEFIGPPPFDRAMACHCDGDKTHNHYSNLRWDNAKGNTADAIAHGTFKPWSWAKLTPDQVREIRELVASGRTQTSVAKIFNTSGQNVSRIARREIWADVA